MHHHHHPQSPLRRSPRQFLSPPQPQPQHRQQLAITPLHEDDHEDRARTTSSLRRSPRQHPHSSNLDLAFASLVDPQPIKVCRPRSAKSTDKVLLLTCGEKSLRRSPRFASSVNGGDSAQCRSALSSEVSRKKSECVGGGKRKSDCLESLIEVSNKRVKRSDFENSEFVRRSTRFSASKSESGAESEVRLTKKSPLKMMKSVHCEEMEGKSKNSEFVRRSPRFSDVKSDTRAEIEVKLRKKSPLKLIKSAECKEIEVKSMKKSPVKLIKSAACKEIEGNSRNSEFVRGSPRFSDLKSDSISEVELKSRKKSPLKLIKSSECKEIEGSSEHSEFMRRSPRFSASKSESVAEIEVKSSKKTPLKLIKSVNCKKIEGKSENSEFVRRSSRFSAPKSESLAETEVKWEKNSPLKSIKSKECEEIKSISEMNSPTLVMAEIADNIDEEKVLRRSPRALPSSFPVDDLYDDFEFGISPKKTKKKKKVPKEEPKVTKVKSNGGGKSENCFFVGDAINEEEALQKWGWRYQLKNRRMKGRSLTGNSMEEEEPILEVKCHYTQAQIRGCIFHLGDCVLIRGEGKQKHIGKIVEFLETMDGEDYFRAQWFYKPEDTVMKEAATFHDKKRIFYSSIMNDNLLACIISKLNVIQVTSQLNLNTSSIELADFYYDMEYCLDYSTFRNLPRDTADRGCLLPSLSCPESILSVTSSPAVDTKPIFESYNAELTMLDLYAGCGAMSTGLCTGSRLSGVNLVTRWAIDADSFACESLRLNHPNIQVRHETADDFLELLKHWDRLCKKFVPEDMQDSFPSSPEVSDLVQACSDAQLDSDIAPDELEVSSLVDISYGDADGSGKEGLKFKVRWKGYGPSEDTWEPIEGLSNCQELIQEFVIKGFKNKILPLPGHVDVICGGPPCQGISGYNRFRTVDAPLTDERNRQLVVFMDIVEFLKPKFVLMENVMDILKFDKGSLGRYALSRLVHMNYQARVGIIAAGCYGLPQFRLRVFFWGATSTEQLPQFPLPSHDVVVRYWPPAEFERNVVAYDEGTQPPELEDAVFLGDAISDLPAVTNYESLDEMTYSRPPETEFQNYIRTTKHEEAVLYDHRPHQLFEDDYIRVCQIPRRKGANFRDLPGVIVGDDNVVRRDPTLKVELLPSGRPLVPEYAFTFEQGKSKRPFARLWWDETMPTIVTYPNCHSQAILHPEQDRVLTVRECARLQGFPDNYRFCGTVKKRYRQVGNAVAIPVAKALGYALGMASQKLTSEEPLLTLPPNFAYSNHL